MLQAQIRRQMPKDGSSFALGWVGRRCEPEGLDTERSRTGNLPTCRSKSMSQMSLMTQAAQWRSVALKKRIAIMVPSSVHSGRLSRAPRMKPHAAIGVRKVEKN